MKQIGLFVDVNQAVAPMRVTAPVAAFVPEEQRPWRTPIRDWFIILKKENGTKVYRNFRGTLIQCQNVRDDYLKGDFHSAWIIDETDKKQVRREAKTKEKT